MSFQYVEATTFKCDLADCSTTQVVAGGTPDSTLVNVFGWSLGHIMFGREYDLCPAHTNELVEWIGAVPIEDPKAEPPTVTNEFNKEEFIACCCAAINPADGEQVCEPCSENNHRGCVGPLA